MSRPDNYAPTEDTDEPDPFAEDFSEEVEATRKKINDLTDQLREYPHATVLIWAKTFTEGGQPYTYVALKAGEGRRGKWFLTGRETTGWSSTTLAAELSSHAVGQVHIATGWDRVR